MQADSGRLLNIFGVVVSIIVREKVSYEHVSNSE
jgi:hypothetical protein